MQNFAATSILATSDNHQKDSSTIQDDDEVKKVEDLKCIRSNQLPLLNKRPVSQRLATFSKLTRNAGATTVAANAKARNSIDEKQKMALTYHASSRQSEVGKAYK